MNMVTRLWFDKQHRGSGSELGRKSAFPLRTSPTTSIVAAWRLSCPLPKGLAAPIAETTSSRCGEAGHCSFLWGCSSCLLSSVAEASLCSGWMAHLSSYFWSGLRSSGSGAEKGSCNVSDIAGDTQIKSLTTTNVRVPPIADVRAGKRTRLLLWAMRSLTCR
jgi:hypothetical protein